ncbi:hypothetical protein [Nocardia sp. NPDC050412]|uniref:hypothetical protein n=1 Tax=Nocardia sp. NPDC050412 TaxID=3364320 RepID=UPI0037BCCF39
MARREWILRGTAAAGSASALVIPFSIRYAAFIPLLPVYSSSAMLAVALILARPYLTYRAD